MHSIAGVSDVRCATIHTFRQPHRPGKRVHEGGNNRRCVVHQGAVHARAAGPRMTPVLRAPGGKCQGRTVLMSGVLVTGVRPFLGNASRPLVFGCKVHDSRPFAGTG